MACQVDHFGSLEEDISACRSVDCCRNMANEVIHYFSFNIFRKDGDIETPSRHFNIIIIPYDCKMKQGLLEISPETKDISLDLPKNTRLVD